MMSQCIHDTVSKRKREAAHWKEDVASVVLRIKRQQHLEAPPVNTMVAAKKVKIASASKTKALNTDIKEIPQNCRKLFGMRNV